MTTRVKPPTLRRTAIDIGLTFGRQFVAGLMQLGLVLMVARLLGPEGAGVYAVALLMPTLMSQVLSLGLASSNVYFVASHQFSLESAWTASRDLMFLMAILGLAGGAIFVLTYGHIAFPGVPQAVLLAAMLIFPSSLMAGVVLGLFQALENFRIFNIIVLLQPLFALAGVFVQWMVDSVSLVAIVSVVAFSHFLTLVVALWLLGRRTSLSASGSTRMVYLRPALAYGIKAHLGNILSYLNYRLDLFLVNFLAGPVAAGLYNVAVKLIEQLWMISQAVSTVIFPRLSAMTEDETARRSFTPLVARTVLWLTLLSAGLLALIAKPLIIFLFGHAFADAVGALLILLPGVVLFSCARVLANDLAARGMVGINLVLAGLAVLVNVVGNLLLIPRFGIEGAAAATTLAYTSTLLIRLALQKRLAKTEWWAAVVPTLGDFRRLCSAIKR